jgi:hypothetical protein
MIACGRSHTPRSENFQPEHCGNTRSSANNQHTLFVIIYEYFSLFVLILQLIVFIDATIFTMLIICLF